MQAIRCKVHEIEFQLPVTDDEFVAGRLHDEVESLYDHHEMFPDCKFEEVIN